MAERFAPRSIVESTTTITTGGSSQQLVAANNVRLGLWVQNQSEGDLRVRVGAAASSSAGILIEPGAIYEFPAHMTPNQVVNIWGATTGQAYHVEEC